MAKISYDANNVILVVHKGFEKEESFLSNEIIGDLVLDISTKKKIVGIELFNASVFLKEFGVEKSLLETLEDTILESEFTSDKVSVQLTLKSKQNNIHVNLPLAVV